MTAPDWLTQRGGAVKLAPDGATWFVFLNHQPSYSLSATPVDGKFGCTIRQTNNGKRIPSKGTFGSEAEAIQNGLSDLGKALGWE
jgi:hypothetical protein